MYTPTADEKATLVMVYTRDCMFRGEVVTKENARVSTWLRTQAVPRYIHLLKPTALMVGGGAAKNQTYTELFLPLELVLALHLAPPQSDPVDYEEGEKNRIMMPVVATVGSFIFKGQIRVSAQTGIGPTLELSKIPWLSLYSLEVSNPYLPQMPPLRVPLAVVSPTQVVFSVQE